MRARDYLGFPLLAIGTAVTTSGHHWFGLVWFWAGVPLIALGLLIVMSGGFEDKIDKALKSYRGPGDYGNRDYHGGSGASHSEGFGGDGGADGD